MAEGAFFLIIWPS